MCGISCDVEQRAEGEDAFVKAWVGHGQVRFVDDLTVDPQDIDVDGARAPSDGVGAGSSEQTFEFESAIEHDANIARGRNEHRTVDVVGLRWTAKGRRDVKGRPVDHGDIGPGADCQDRSFDRTHAVAEVCPEAEHDAARMLHARTFVWRREGSQWGNRFVAGTLDASSGRRVDQFPRCRPFFSTHSITLTAWSVPVNRLNS